MVYRLSKKYPSGVNGKKAFLPPYFLSFASVPLFDYLTDKILIGDLGFWLFWPFLALFPMVILALLIGALLEFAEWYKSWLEK